MCCLDHKDPINLNSYLFYEKRLIIGWLWIYLRESRARHPRYLVWDTCRYMYIINWSSFTQLANNTQQRHWSIISTIAHVTVCICLIIALVCFQVVRNISNARDKLNNFVNDSAISAAHFRSILADIFFYQWLL